MSEREPLAPGRIPSTKPDDSERDYRDCVERMDDFERRHVGEPGHQRMVERMRELGRWSEQKQWSVATASRPVDRRPGCDGRVHRLALAQRPPEPRLDFRAAPALGPKVRFGWLGLSPGAQTRRASLARPRRTTRKAHDGPNSRL